MPALKVGLAAYKSSFYDPKTNTYITLENPLRTINYDDNTDLSGICHACNAQTPALLLYEGKFPKATLDAWKAKYDLVGKQAKARADKVQEKSGDVTEEVPPTEPAPEPEPEPEPAPEPDPDPEPEVPEEPVDPASGGEGIQTFAAQALSLDLGEEPAEEPVVEPVKKATTKKTTKKTASK